MDIMGILGIILGFLCMVIGIMINGTLGSYWDSASIFITLGGTIFAAMASVRFDTFKNLFKLVGIALRRDDTDFTGSIQTLIHLANVARKDGVLALEGEAENLDDNFLKKGLLLVVDGSDPELVKNILQTEINFIEERHEQGQSMFKSMASYAPAFGMAGTLIGLINMLQELDKPETLGPAMAVALITTFYGVLLANLWFMPLARRLEDKTIIEISHKEMIIEGVLSIQAGENPRIIEEKLKAFLSQEEQENIEVTKRFNVAREMSDG